MSDSLPSNPAAEPSKARTVMATVVLGAFGVFIWWMIETRSAAPPPPLRPTATETAP